MRAREVAIEYRFIEVGFESERPREYRLIKVGLQGIRPREYSK